MRDSVIVFSIQKLFNVKETKVHTSQIFDYQEAFLTHDAYGVIFVKTLEENTNKKIFSHKLSEDIKMRLESVIVNEKQAGKYVKTLCNDMYTEETWTEMVKSQ